MFVGLLVFVFCYMWSFVRYVGVYYTLGLLDCARSLRRGFRYIEVLSHTCYCYFGRARVSFVIPRTSLYRGSLNRGSTVFDYNVKKAHPYSGTEWKLDKWFSLRSAPRN